MFVATIIFKNETKIHKSPNIKFSSVIW